MSRQNGPGTRAGVYFREGLLDAVDEVCEEYSLSRSRVINDALAEKIEGDDALQNVVPESTLQLAQQERREREMLDRQKRREKKHSWEDRILGHFRERIEGDAAYRVEGMEDLAEGYVEDAEIWMADDDDMIAEARQKVDEWLSWYEAGYWARKHADAVDTEVNSSDVSGWFEVGRDIFRLREHVEDVVAHVREVADGSAGWDSDAVIDSVASEWSVSRGAAHLLIESLTVEDVSVQEALAVGGESLRATEDLALTAGGPEPEPELAEGDVEEETDSSPDVVEATADVVDSSPASVEELPADAIVRKGGRSEDVVETDADDAEAEETEREEVTVETDGGPSTTIDGGLSPEDLTTEELIETAVGMVETGAGEDAIVRELRPDAPSETAVECAIEVARERASVEGDAPGEENPAVTDGGRETEEDADT